MTKNTFLSAFERIKRISRCEEEMWKEHFDPNTIMFRAHCMLNHSIYLSIELLASNNSL